MPLKFLFPEKLTFDLGFEESMQQNLNLNSFSSLFSRKEWDFYFPMI